jgi:hypothetical protein
MLGDDAPLVVLPSGQLTIESGDVFRPPHDHTFELSIAPKPSVQADVVAEVAVRWLSPNDAILGKLAVRCYTPIQLTIAFFLVGTKAETERENLAKWPEVQEDDLAKYLDVINAVYEPAGISFTSITKQLVVTPVAGTGILKEGTDMALLCRAGQAILQQENPGTRAIMVFIVDAYKSTVQGQGVSPKMASGTAGIYFAENLKDFSADTDNMLFQQRILPRLVRDPQDPSQNINLETLVDTIQSPQEKVGGNVGNMTITSREEQQAKAIAQFQELAAPYGVVYDPAGKLVNAFQPSEPPSKLAFRHYIPGVVMASRIAGDSAPPLLASDRMHWGRAIAHELGHFFTLFHPGDPTYGGDVKADDVWSRRRLLYAHGSFPPKTLSASTVATAKVAASVAAMMPLGVITAPIVAADVTNSLAGPPMNLGFGDLEPGILLTHTHLHYSTTTLDPPGGEVETARGVAALWAGRGQQP